jgi:hypothetical protein
MRQLVETQMREVETESVDIPGTQLRAAGLRKLLRRLRTDHARWTAAALGSGLVTLMLLHGAHADDFSKAYYDSRVDQLVVSMIYSGTNPKHTFTLQWGQCQDVNGSNLHEVAVQVLDSQWQDEALRPYKKTVRFSLVGIPCRPAKVTLRTAPRFIYTVLIPA